MHPNMAERQDTMIHHPFEHQSYNPDTLLDTVKEWFGLASDRALARRLRLGPPTISRIRNRRQPASSEVLLRMHEATSFPIRDLRFLAGDFRWHTGLSAVWLSPAAVASHLSAPALTCAHAVLNRSGRTMPP
jgi:transcriptional regulator with XRE-family HTH domain